MKECFIDVETTGLDPNECAVLQISGLVCVDGKEKETFDIFVAPHENAKIDPAALAVHGIELDDKRMIRPREAYHKLLTVFEHYIDKYNRNDKMFFIGYNVLGFDWPFMYKFWERQGDPYFGSWFFYPPLDVVVLAAHHLMEFRPFMKDFKLGTVANRLGLSPKGDLHDAMTDIRLTKEIYERVIGGTK